MSWIDDLNNQAAMQVANGARHIYVPPQPVQQQLPQPQAKKKKNFLTSLISEGGALGGAAAGAAAGSVVPIIGTSIGAVLGGAAGAFGGRLAENKVRDDRWGVGDAAGEAALTGLLGAPVRTAKYGLTAAKTYKNGRKATSLAEALRAGQLSGVATGNGGAVMSGVDNLIPRGIPVTFIDSTAVGTPVKQTVRNTLTNPSLSELDTTIRGLTDQGYSVASKLGRTPGSALPSGIGVAPDFTPLMQSPRLSSVAITADRTSIPFTSGQETKNVLPALRSGNASAMGTAAERAARSSTGELAQVPVTNLSDALRAGANAADAPGIMRRLNGKARSRVANVATNVRDDAALKNFKLNDSNWIYQFQRKVGEDPGAFAARVGFATSTPKDVATKFYNPLQDVYTAQLERIPAITKADVKTALDKRIADYMRSDVADVRAIGEKLQASSDELLNRLPDNMSALDARAKKAAFQSAVDEKLTDTAGKLSNNTNKQIADVFRSLVNDKADAAGIVINPASLPVKGIKATSIRELGNELRGIKEFADKAAIKQNVGRGKNPIGITPLLSGGAGGTAFGPVGAAGGIAMSTAANSQAGRKAEFNLAQRLNQLAQNTGKGSPARTGMGIGARGATAATLAEALGGGQSSPLDPSMSANTRMNSISAAPPMNANIMQQQYSNGADLSSALQSASQNNPFDPANIQANVQAILAQGGDFTDVQKYLSIAQSMQDMQTAGGNGLNTTTANLVASSANATNTLDQLEGLFGDAGGGSGKIGGFVKNKLAGAGLEGNAQTYNDLSASSVSQLARALNGGGQVSDADAAVVVQALPRITDSPDVAARKFAALRARLAAARQNTLMYNNAAEPDTLAGALAM